MIRDIFTVIFGSILLIAVMVAVSSWHNRAGGYCDQAKGTAQEYNINYIICQ